MDKILYLTSRLPYPQIGGDRIRSNWILKVLSKYFKVHLVSITEEDPDKYFHLWANDLGITYNIFKKHRLRSYFNVLKSLSNKKPLQVNYYYFKEVKDYVDSIYTNFDLLFAVLIRTAEYVLDKDKPKILEMTDSIAQNYMRSKNQTRSLKWKFIYTIETEKLFNYEKKCLREFDKVIFVNKEEADYYNYPAKTECIPNGVNRNLLEYEKLNQSYNKYVVFFGKMDYQPNVDAVIWFSSKVLPLLKNDIKFAIIGANPTKTVKNLEKEHSNVIVTGYLKDPYEIIKSSLCVVAPMQTGGGIQNKILESMALGTINIVSSLAARPIGALNNIHLLIIDDPIEMARTINEINIKPEKYKHLKFNSRKFIADNFTWDIYEDKLIELIMQIIRNRA